MCVCVCERERERERERVSGVYVQSTCEHFIIVKGVGVNKCVCVCV